jgi:aminoglycoside phosphotransferase
MTMSVMDAGPFVDDVRAVAAHYGVAEKEVVPPRTQGQVNLTVFLGGELVLRIPRTTKAAEQLSKEAEIIPLVRDAGVPTPKLVSYDSTLSIASVPYMVLQRVHGATLAEQAPDPTARRRTLESLGEILVTLHRIRFSKVGRVSWIPEPFTFSQSELLHELVEAGEIGAAQHDWLLERFTLLQPEGPRRTDPILLHRDVIPSNVMVGHDGLVTALLDWGCAEWGSPARDLVGLPIGALPDLLSGYRSALRATSSRDHPDGDFTLERDALWYHLYLALARLLKKPSTSEDRNWAAPRSATLLDLLAFTSSAVTEPWAALLRGIR